MTARRLANVLAQVASGDNHARLHGFVLVPFEEMRDVPLGSFAAAYRLESRKALAAPDSISALAKPRHSCTLEGFAQMRDALFGTHYRAQIRLDDEERGFSSDSPVFTSPVVAIDFQNRTIETLNTVYAF